MFIVDGIGSSTVIGSTVIALVRPDPARQQAAAPAAAVQAKPAGGAAGNATGLWPCTKTAHACLRARGRCPGWLWYLSYVLGRPEAALVGGGVELPGQLPPAGTTAAHSNWVGLTCEGADLFEEELGRRMTKRARGMTAMRTDKHGTSRETQREAESPATAPWPCPPLLQVRPRPRLRTETRSAQCREDRPALAERIGVALVIVGAEPRG